MSTILETDLNVTPRLTTLIELRPSPTWMAEGECVRCTMHCRALGHHSTLHSSSDGDCHCVKGALSKAMTSCSGSDYRHFSTGLGFPPVSFTVWPELSTEGSAFNTDVLDSQFVKVSSNSNTKETQISFS